MSEAIQKLTSSSAHDLSERSITECFAQQVETNGERTAVQLNGKHITYTELDRFSNRIAHAVDTRLNNTGCVPVALLAEPGPEYAAAILGILKTGVAYLPLDPNQPILRQSAILDNSTACVLLHDAVHADRAHALGEGRIETIEIDWVNGRYPDHEPEILVSPAAPAYIIYTSGSTGTPKGVVVSHRTVVHSSLVNHGLVLTENDRSALCLSAAHGLSASVLFHTLLNGGALLPFDLRRQGVSAFASWLRNERISMFKATPSIARLLVEAMDPGESLPDLRYLSLGGEPLYAEDIKQLWTYLGSQCRIVSGMSATETKRICQLIIDRSTHIDDGVVSVGYPVIGKRIRIVDESGIDVAPGTIGEMWVQSRYLADGYWRDPTLTRERFVPVADFDEERQYHTGDLARIRPDGTIELCGRQDLQLKIRGFRAQPAETAAALHGMAGVQDAVVVHEPIDDITHQLVAYVVITDAALDTDLIRSRLTELVPDYLVPARLVIVDALPLTESGKVDLVALQQLDAGDNRDAATIPVECNTRTERIVLNTVRNLLHGDSIGLDEDFTSAGVDSLSAAALLVRVEQIFQVNISLGDLFAKPTLAALVARIERLRACPAASRSGQDTLIVPLATGSNGLPIILVPGGGGGEIELFLSYDELVGELGHLHPVYGIRATTPDGRMAAGRSIEAMVETLIPALLALQPHGPYVLLGGCYGGLLALELGRQLLRQDERVVVLLLDTFIPGRRLRGWRAWQNSGQRNLRRARAVVGRIHHHWTLARQWRGRQRMEYLLGRLSAAPRLVKEAGVRKPYHSEPAVAQRIAAARTAYKDALYRHQLRPYPGSITLILSEDNPKRSRAPIWHKYVSGELRLRTIIGDHHSSIRAHAPVTARVISECLAELAGWLDSDGEQNL